MRALVWLLGVADAILGLRMAYRIDPGWAWFWWMFLGLWFFVGFLVLGAVIWRAVTRGKSGAAAGSAGPFAAAPRKARVAGGGDE